jgi:hypothetical protein
MSKLIIDLDALIATLHEALTAQGKPVPDNKELYKYLSKNGHVVLASWISTRKGLNLERANKLISAFNAEFLVLGIKPVELKQVSNPK